MDHRIGPRPPRFFTPDAQFLSFLAMQEDLALGSAFEGRVVRHRAGEVQPRRHRHAELEVNLVVRGRASYLLGDRRYELTPGTLTWLFPGQEHVLVEESGDHELWWAVFRPELVARIATTEPMHPLLARTPRGQFSRRLDGHRARRIHALFTELHGRDEILLNAGLPYLLVVAWRAFLESDDVVEGLDVHPAVETVARLLRADPNAGDLAALARAAQLSPAHLSRLFKAQTGWSITRFRNHQRLQRFRVLYRDGRHTTALAAALEAGFGSYAQFHRVFRAETGQSPVRR
jgi:AraC-like DNA-binding protein/quercetin dioxygenase-like cupin family protein